MAHPINYRMEDLSAIYRGVEDVLKYDDLSFGNLEFPVVPEKPEAGFPDFNVHPDYVAAAVYGGFDVFSLANNHIMDQGEDGLYATLATMEQLSSELPYRIWMSGLKRKHEPWEVTDIHIKGWNIGFTAVSQYSNRKADKDMLRVVDYRRDDEREDFIRWVSDRAGNYDLFIISYHGGTEYSRKADEKKNAFFMRLLEAGVDIVYGHHPHVLQPVELVETEEGEKLILNSCGNFISGQNRIIDPALPTEEWSYTGDSAVFRIQVENISGRTLMSIRKPLLIGNVITPERDVLVMPLEDIASSPLYGEWADFYESRYEIMSAWVANDFLILHRNRTDDAGTSVLQ